MVRLHGNSGRSPLESQDSALWQKTLAASLKISLLIISILIAYWVFCALAYGQASKLIPPELPMVTDITCKVEPTPDGWLARAVVSYVNPERHHDGTPWIVPIIEYKGKNRKKARQKAESACNEWLDAVNKVRAEIQPVDVSKLKEKK